MHIDELITELRRKGVFITVRDAQLAVNAKPECLSKEILELIKERKTEILDFFQRVSQAENKSAIEQAENRPFYELTYGQQRLYFLYEFDKTSTAYNMPSVLQLTGELDDELLTDAFNVLLQRYDVLRTSFEMQDGLPVQKILDQAFLKIVKLKAEQGQLKSVINNFIKPFDLSKAPLMRVGLISLTATEHVLIIDIHHIVSDGISGKILIKDFISLFNKENLPVLTLQYKDYATWQQSAVQKQETLLHKDFWLKDYAEEVLNLDLPVDFARPLEKQYGGAAIKSALELSDSLALKQLAEKEGVTLFMVMFATFNLLLSKLSNQQDIVVGIPVAGRDYSGLENMPGMFVNTLPVRTRPTGDLSFKEFLSLVKQKILSCFEHQAYPYEEMIEQLHIKREASRNPLFDVMFSYQNDEPSTLASTVLDIGFLDYADIKAKFDLRLDVSSRANGLILKFEYATAIFKADTIIRFEGYFKKILASVLENPDRTLAEIDMISDQESYKMLNEFNQTAADYAKEKTIIDLFGEQVLKTPDQPALVSGGTVLTYKELDLRSTAIAYYFIEEKGLLHGDLIGVMLEHETQLVPLLLGIMKAGCTYVPLDPSYPAERIHGIISGANLKLVVARGKYAALPSSYGGSVLNLDIAEHEMRSKDYPTVFKPLSSTNDLAYILYTSGSTGIPKGVMIKHLSLVNYINWAVINYGFTEETIFPLYSSISFDLTVTSLFCPLIIGGSLIVYQEEERGVLIEKVFRENKVTVIKLTPSHLKAVMSGNWLDNLSVKNIKKYIIGGEDLSTQLARELYNYYDGQVEIYNEYGPTEATVGCMIYKFDPDDTGLSVPIGKPINNTQIYLLDRDMKPVGEGVAGEIYICGVGLASGYLNEPELSKERFMTNLFTPGTKMYRTGDRAAMNSAGQLVFRGRLDDQVKINGYRIELEDIEANLLAYESIKEVIVLADPKSNQLVAYYVSHEELNAANLKSFLAAKLPSYMVPAFYMPVKEFLITINGKIDKKALPVPELRHEESYQAPTNDLETKLVSIWAEVLDAEEKMISVNKSFFEMGGNSLKLIKLTSQLNQTFKWSVSLPDMFRYPTILSLIKFMEEGDSKTEEYKKNIQEELTGMQDILDFL